MMKFSLAQHSKCSGFTLLEVLVVASIIIVLSIIVVVNYEFGGYQHNLQRSAHKLSQDLRRAEEMAMSVKEFEGSIPPGGYGIYIDYNIMPTQYILFADENGNKEYDVGEGVGDLISFEDYVQIDHACVEELCALQISVTFSPPDPTIRFNSQEESYAYIVLRSEKVEGYVTVWINDAGLVEIQQGTP